MLNVLCCPLCCECYCLIIVFTAALSIDPYGQHGLMLQHKNLWCNYIRFTLVFLFVFLTGSVRWFVGLRTLLFCFSLQRICAENTV